MPWLVDLGVMTPEGKVRNSRYDKFKQLNRYLNLYRISFRNFRKTGRSGSLISDVESPIWTFAMYYYLKELNHYDIQVTGLDLKADVIEKCRSLADKYGYDRLDFQQGDIASYEGADQVGYGGNSSCL